jgi:hypothetical protein
VSQKIRSEVPLEGFISRIPDSLVPEDRQLVERLARVTVTDTASRSTSGALYGQAKAAVPVPLYRLDPNGQIRVRLPGPSSGAHQQVHEKWKAALLDAGLVPSDASDGGMGYALTLDHWKLRAEALISAIKTLAADA